MQYRVWAEINRSRLQHNGEILCRLLGGASRLMIVCKANAYGHGVTHALEAARKIGVTQLGVGDSHEALELRELGWEHEVLVLGSLIDEEIISIAQNNIALSIHSLERIRFLDSLTRQLKKPLDVHLKVDTGLRRFGTSPEKAPELASLIKASEYLRWKGVMTHLAAPQNSTHTQEQLKIFDEVVKKLSPLPPEVKIHAAGTNAALRFPESRFDFVRCGLGIWGLTTESNLKPVLSLYSQIIFIKDVPQGARVGYEGDYICPQPTRLAIFPMGYSDGFRFCFSNQAHVLINGQKAPVRGRVSMDYTTIDITHIPDVQVGDRVTLIGQDQKESLTASDWQQWAQTTIYEITCLLGSRVHRVAVD